MVIIIEKTEAPHRIFFLVEQANGQTFFNKMLVHRELTRPEINVYIYIFHARIHTELSIE